MKRLAMFALCSLLVVGLGSCMKLHEDFVIMPDGSGKIVLTFAVSPEFTKTEPGEEPKDPIDEFMDGDPDEMEDSWAGIVAVTKPKKAKIGDWEGLTLSLYFRDINKVKMFETGMGEEEKKVKLSFVFEKKEDGFVLDVRDTKFSPNEKEGAEDVPEAFRKQMEEMFKKMMKGFEMKTSLTMPGEIKKAEGYTSKEGRKAVLTVSEKDVEKQADFKKYSSRKVVCGASQVTEEEQKAFKDELAAATAEWDRLKAEMKRRNAEKKKRDKGSDDDR